jgi:hypothetical protein
MKINEIKKRIKEDFDDDDFEAMKGAGIDPADSDEDEGEGFSQKAMFDQLGKVLDSRGNPNPVTTVVTDDGKEHKVTVAQAQMLRMMLSAEGMKPNIKMQFTKDMQQSAHLHDFLDMQDPKQMATLFMKKYM